MATCVPKQLLELVGNATATSPRPPGSEEGELQRSTAAILASINCLRGALESGQLRGGPGDEGGTPSSDGKPSPGSALACIPLLEEIRYCSGTGAGAAGSRCRHQLNLPSPVPPPSPSGSV